MSAAAATGERAPKPQKAKASPWDTWSVARRLAVTRSLTDNPLDIEATAETAFDRLPPLLQTQIQDVIDKAPKRKKKGAASPPEDAAPDEDHAAERPAGNADSDAEAAPADEPALDDPREEAPAAGPADDEPSILQDYRDASTAFLRFLDEAEVDDGLGAWLRFTPVPQVQGGDGWTPLLALLASADVNVPSIVDATGSVTVRRGSLGKGERVKVANLRAWVTRAPPPSEDAAFAPRARGQVTLTGDEPRVFCTCELVPGKPAYEGETDAFDYKVPVDDARNLVTIASSEAQLATLDPFVKTKKTIRGLDRDDARRQMLAIVDQLRQAVPRTNHTLERDA